MFLTFKKFVPLNRKHKNFCTPSLSFEQWAKNPHASQIGCRVAPFWIHWACLTTAECPCLGLYAREMPGFLSPLLLLLLPFTYSSAAPNHFRKAPDQHAVGREPSTKLSTRSVGSLYMSTAMTGSPGGYEFCVLSV